MQWRSFTVACALLLESAITGKELDPGFAVTGDMNADGSVQPIGGVEAKLRGATNRNCTHIAIPKDNVTSIHDAVLIDGIAQVTAIQVFSIATFEQANAIAQSKKSDQIQTAIDRFAEIQKLYVERPGAFSRTLRHPKVIEKLRQITKAAPNHLSASVLLTFAEGRAPKTLSLNGSFTFIDQNAYQIVDVIKNGKVAEVQGLYDDQVADVLTLLRRSKLMLDRRTWEWTDRLIRWGELMREYQTNRPKAARNANKLIKSINSAADAVRAERTQLLEDAEIIEALLE